jgi:repressor LexA
LREGGGVTTLGRRLAALRNEAGLTQVDLGKIVGASQDTISIWETDKGGVNHEMLKRLADAFAERLGRAVTVDYLLARGGIDDNQPPVPGAWWPGLTVKVPIYGRIAAGEPALAEQNIEGWEEVRVQETQNGEYFLLRVKGDSMDGAGIKDGDLVYIRRQSTVDDGEIAVVLVGSEEATLKCVYRANSQVILEAQNPKYPPLFKRPEEVQILGKALWSKHYL